MTSWQCLTNYFSEDVQARHDKDPTNHFLAKRIQCKSGHQIESAILDNQMLNTFSKIELRWNTDMEQADENYIYKTSSNLC